MTNEQVIAKAEAAGCAAEIEHLTASARNITEIVKMAGDKKLANQWVPYFDGIMDRLRVLLDIAEED